MVLVACITGPVGGSPALLKTKIMEKIYDHIKLKVEQNQGTIKSVVDKLINSNMELMAALERAKMEIIALTESDQPQNKIHYPKFIDKAISNAKIKK